MSALAALELAEQGKPVFPCNRKTKAPYIANGFKGASQDLEQIRRWWDQHPGALIGVPTGSATGLLVIDIDPAGKDWYVENLIELACGRIHTTPRGHHLLYRCPEPAPSCSTSKISPGVDVRGEGGYSLWWPPEGYPVVGGLDDIGEAPEWLLSQLAPAQPPPVALVPSSEEVIAEPQWLELLSALEYLDPDAVYDTWIKIGMALCTLGQRGFIAWRDWSSKGGGFKTGECEAKAQSFARGGVTYRTVFTLAQEAGWQNPLSNVSGLATPAKQLADQLVASQKPPSLAEVPVGDLRNATPPSVSFLINPLVPRSTLTLLGAHGGMGKSTLALMWAAFVACGRDFAGLEVQQGKALFLSLEDPGSLVRHRLKKICEHYDLDYGHIEQNLIVLDGSSIDGYLAVERSEAGIKQLAMTPVYDQLTSYSEVCDLVVIDNASDGFAGNEIDKRSVTQFLKSLKRLAQKSDCSVLLLTHIDKMAARNGAQGNSYSGNTAWHNAPRSRAAMIYNEEGHIVLEHEKANLSPKADPIELSWDAGVLAPIARDRVSEQLKGEQQAKSDASAVLAVMKIALAVDDFSLTNAASGPLTTYHQLQSFPEFPREFSGKAGRKRFWAAVIKLRRDGSIQEVEYTGTGRNKKKRLELTHPTDASALVGAPKSAVGIYPHTPLAQLTHADGRVSSDLENKTRTHATHATHAPCKRCDGEGCAFCKTKTAG